MQQRIEQALLLTFIVMIAFACQDQQGSLTGKIRDGLTLNPVDSVNVTVESQKDSATTVVQTREDGTYQFTSLEDGPYELRTSRNGYVNATRFAEVFKEEQVRLDIALSRSTDSMDLIVVVRIFSEATGLPVSGARVDLFSGTAPGRYTLSETLETEAGGRVEFEAGSVNDRQVRFFKLQVSALGFLNEELEFQLSFERPTTSIDVNLEPVES